MTRRLLLAAVAAGAIVYVSGVAHRPILADRAPRALDCDGSPVPGTGFVSATP
ncbi:MAG TPA: hypothetical protein VGQ92_15420 [Actinoplanes sp.]|jgi:hypothetical protein|nr:hypothetical protein [Actinoplanes sp.]